VSEDNALNALEAVREQLNADLPAGLLEELLRIEREYAFDEDKREFALRKVDELIDRYLRDGLQS
jgi:hypothetical protein